MILSDRELREYIESGRLRIDPMRRDTIRENGVDLTIGDQILRMRPVHVALDTKRSLPVEQYYQREGPGEDGAFVIRPFDRVLLHTVEVISVPKDLMGFVNLRSTLARLGLIIPPTIIDAGFEGQLTIEVAGGAFPVKLYPGQRFLHVVFAKLTSPVERPYQGTYLGQTGPMPPKLPIR